MNGPAIFSIKPACVLATARAKLVIDEVESLPVDVDDEHWQPAIVGPSLKLASTMDTLTEGWSLLVSVTAVWMIMAVAASTLWRPLP